MEYFHILPLLPSISSEGIYLHFSSTSLLPSDQVTKRTTIIPNVQKFSKSYFKKQLPPITATPRFGGALIRWVTYDSKDSYHTEVKVTQGKYLVSAGPSGTVPSATTGRDDRNETKVKGLCRLGGLSQGVKHLDTKVSKKTGYCIYKYIHRAQIIKIRRGFNSNLTYQHLLCPAALSKPQRRISSLLSIRFATSFPGNAKAPPSFLQDATVGTAGPWANQTSHQTKGLASREVFCRVEIYQNKR